MSADKARRRGSMLSALRRGKADKAARQSLDDHERLREAAARSTGLHSILPDLGDDDQNTLKRRAAGVDLRQLARDEAAAKLCGEQTAPLPTVPVFPCAQSALAAHTQLAGPLLKHQTPTTLARLVGSKAWKSRHGVFCTYALRDCSCARTAAHSCDSATRTLACLHLFATAAPEALELARLIVTEDSVVFVVEPTLAQDDSRRGPRDLDGRKGVFQVQGISGAPPQPLPDKSTKRSLRRESANTVKSGLSHRPHALSLGLPSSSSSGNLTLGLDDDSRVHAVWFLQCPDADARQRWVSCIKRAVLLQRAERAGFGGTIHFTSPRSVTDPLPSGDLDVVLAMRAHAHRGSTVPYASPPVTPMTSTFAPSAHFAPITPSSNVFASPVSPGSESSHVDAISLAYTRSQTPTYAPSVHTTHTAPVSHSKSRSRSSTVTAPVQALRGLFTRPPSRSASVAASKRVRTSSGTMPSTPAPNHLASFTGHEPNAYPLGTPISAGLGSMDLSSSTTTDDLAPPTLPGLGPSGLPLPAPTSKGPASLPPPPRAKRAGSVSHVLNRGDETVRVRDEEDGARRPVLVPMLSLSFGRGDDLDRGQHELSRQNDSGRAHQGQSDPVQGHDDMGRGHDDMGQDLDSRLYDARRDESRVLPPMLAPPSSPLPVPPGPGASRSSLRLPGVGAHATGSALALGLHHSQGSAPAPAFALPLPAVNVSLADLPQPQAQHVAKLNLASATGLSASGSGPQASTSGPQAGTSGPQASTSTATSGLSPHPPTLALRTMGSIPILPGSWPIAPESISAVTPSDSAVTPSAVTPSEYALSPSDTLNYPSNDAYGFSPYRASMTSDAFRVSIHSDAYQAVSPTSDMYLTAHEPASASTYSVPGGSYLNLIGSSSNLHLPGFAGLGGSASHLASTSHLAIGSTSHLVMNSTTNLATSSTSHYDTTSTSHLDLSDTTPHASSTPFTTTASDSSQASVYSVKAGRSSLDAFRTGGSDTVRSRSDTFRSNSSDLFRSNNSDVFRSSSSDVFRTNGNGARVSLAFGRGVLHEYPEGDGWEGDYHSGRGSVRDYGSGSYAHSGSARDYAHSGSGREYSQSAYTQSINVRESPTRTVATGSYRDREGSPAAYRDRDPDSVPSSPSSQADHYAGPTGGLFDNARRDTFGVRRDSFGAVPRESFVVADDSVHPFSSASPSQTPVKSAAPSPAGRRAHRRAGSYAGPTLYTIASGSLSFDRRQSQRSKPELPPAAPPPSVPLPPTPATSRPSTPISRPRTPSRQSTSTPPVPPLPSAPKSSLRTRLRMLSTPSTPEPVPRELGPPHEEDLAQPISRVPFQMLVREDSSIRRAPSEHGSCREVHGGMGTSLPPPPRTRPMAIRQYSCSASASDREGSSEGRRSDESGKRGARDSGVDLEHRGD